MDAGGAGLVVGGAPRVERRTGEGMLGDVVIEVCFSLLDGVRYVGWFQRVPDAQSSCSSPAAVRASGGEGARQQGLRERCKEDCRTEKAEMTRRQHAVAPVHEKVQVERAWRWCNERCNAR